MVIRPLSAAAALALAAIWSFSNRTDLAAQEASGSSADRIAGVLVEGKVVDHESGGPVAGAAVSLGAGPSGVRGRGTRITDDEGRFEFRDVPEGAYGLSVAAPGYRDMTDTLQVPAQGGVDLILPLSGDPIRLEPILVTAERFPAPDRDYERRRRGGGSGFLVTREDIEERHPRFLSELLHRVPGGMVVPTPPHGYTLLLRAQCRPGIWMDGVPLVGASSIDQAFTPQNVEAVEVYHGFELPVEYGVDTCGGVLVWTRNGSTPPSGAEGGSTVKSGVVGALLKATAIILVVVLLTR